ncbi:MULTISPECIES: hypothetical protein [Runella]|uniref:Uncharacterized protein n=1 Tax=Runella defluvii TaxID=370973 RepID=A0A7W6EP65_9BACT|nr:MULTISPECIES: hypothetical protein [Runella]AYQ33830.1 hypothetical protein DTQ70_17460 [Runella sp. SP2]MBB3837032.1 hypothetical protein [Runella defluvii]HAK78456.1 hypothetical protein [Runella sp.]HAO50636.1 hypothetical protein [Runella sp.]
MKRNFLKISALLLTVSLASCKYQKNNTIEQTDLRAGDEYVYGVHPDSAARQTKIKYTAKPELEQRTNAIREKLFGGATPETTAPAATPADTVVAAK